MLTGQFGPDVSQAFAIDFLRRHRERPFFLYLPMVLTHGQSFASPVVPTPANKTTGRPPQEMFADMLRYADKLIGELVAEIEKLGPARKHDPVRRQRQRHRASISGPPQGAAGAGRSVFADRGRRQRRAARQQPAGARRPHDSAGGFQRYLSHGLRADRRRAGFAAIGPTASRWPPICAAGRSGCRRANGF